MTEKEGFLDQFKIDYGADQIREEYFDNPKYDKERIFYTITFVIYNIICITALIMFYRLRDSYIIRQRNFKLTFAGGIITYIQTVISFLSVITTKVPCGISIYSTNVLNVIALQFFFSRSLRVILSYYFNIYKVTSLKKSKVKESYYGEKEPNSYLPKIYKKIKLIIAIFIIIPTLIALVSEIVIQKKVENDITAFINNNPKSQKMSNGMCKFSDFFTPKSSSGAVVGMRGGREVYSNHTGYDPYSIQYGKGRNINQYGIQYDFQFDYNARYIKENIPQYGQNNTQLGNQNGGQNSTLIDNSQNELNGIQNSDSNDNNNIKNNKSNGEKRIKFRNRNETTYCYDEENYGDDNSPNSNYGDYYDVVSGFGYYYIICSIVITIFMFNIKDANKYGVKFECLSTSILCLLINLFNKFITPYARNDENYLWMNFCSDRKFEFFLYLFTVTNGAKLFFSITPMYILFASIILPLIHYRKSKTEKNKYFQEPLSSIQYFYKVLNTPALVNELRDIAIKEFSVENVLFWDNYQLLQKMVYRYQIEYAKAKAMNDEKYIAQYDFEGYYQQQLLSSSQQMASSMDSYSYDPNMAIPRQIMPYFTSFYYTFIHYEGPASVNLSGNTIAQIQNDISTYPTVGIFDNAKNEVVEMMYTSVFPILLKNNKRHFELSLLNY